jgi:hypothetical protein
MDSKPTKLKRVHDAVLRGALAVVWMAGMLLAIVEFLFYISADSDQSPSIYLIRCAAAALVALVAGGLHAYLLGTGS